MIGKGDTRSDEMGLFLGRDVCFEGKMNFQGMARLDGKFDGEILSGDVLIIGETGSINADIKVGTIIVSGEVKGNVFATAKIEIHSPGKLHGNIEAPNLVIEEGGIFHGKCKMAKRKKVVPNKVTPIKENEPSPK